MVKIFYPSLLQYCPDFMKRMHTWYRRACRLHLTSLWARYPSEVFGLRTVGITDIMFDFEDIQVMFRLKELNIEMVRLWCI